MRAGFTQVRCFFAQPLSIEEQRRTAWAEVDSLREFLNPDDFSLTVEGYPAPWRYYAIARKEWKILTFNPRKKSRGGFYQPTRDTKRDLVKPAPTICPFVNGGSGDF